MNKIENSESENLHETEKLPIVPVSLILDKRAKIPGKSSSCSFISFHCFSSLDSAPMAVAKSSTIAAEFTALNSFLFEVSDEGG